MSIQFSFSVTNKTDYSIGSTFFVIVFDTEDVSQYIDTEAIGEDEDDQVMPLLMLSMVFQD